jgi:hypothetical protein
MDSEGGETFWPIMPINSCHFDKYNILYKGIATRLTSREIEKANRPTVYTVTTDDTTFALAKTSEINVCGYKLLRTEHPKLLIMETQQGKSFKIHTRVSVDNLDIFLYVNSKFVYVEKHIKTQLSRL